MLARSLLVGARVSHRATALARASPRDNRRAATLAREEAAQGRGKTAFELRDLRRTTDLNKRRLGLAREYGDRPEIARCLNNLAGVAEVEGDTRRATLLLRQSVRITRELGDRLESPLRNLSRIALSEGDLERAEAFASESLALARERGDLEQILEVISTIGVVRIQQGRFAEAVNLEREALQLADQLQHKNAFRSCCEDLALMLVRCGNIERAAQLLGKAQALREELGRGGLGDGEPTPQVHPLLAGAVAEVRRGLNEEERLEAMSIGRNTDLRELLEAALGDAETAARYGGHAGD